MIIPFPPGQATDIFGRLFAQRLSSIWGQGVVVEGPHGDFYLRAAEAPLLLMAGGSGLAPLLALLEVIFGIALAWLGAGETPGPRVLMGGTLVLLALFGNEWWGWRQSR